MSNTQYWRERQATERLVNNLQTSGQMFYIREAMERDDESVEYIAAQLALLWRTPYARLEKAIHIALREKAKWEENHA